MWRASSTSNARSILFTAAVDIERSSLTCDHMFGRKIFFSQKVEHKHNYTQLVCALVMEAASLQAAEVECILMIV